MDKARITRLQIRRNISTTWSNDNPKILSGEICLETDTGFIKIGLESPDSLWNDIPYLHASAIPSILNSIQIKDIEGLDIELDSKANKDHSHANQTLWKIVTKDDVLVDNDQVLILESISLYLPRQPVNGSWVRLKTQNASAQLISSFLISVESKDSSKRLTLEPFKDVTLVFVSGEWLSI